MLKLVHTNEQSSFQGQKLWFWFSLGCFVLNFLWNIHIQESIDDWTNCSKFLLDENMIEGNWRQESKKYIFICVKIYRKEALTVPIKVKLIGGILKKLSSMHSKKAFICGWKSKFKWLKNTCFGKAEKTFCFCLA